MSKREEYIQELKTKVNGLVTLKFQGNYKKCYNHYDSLRKRNGRIDRDSLKAMLKDADIGYIKRNILVNAIMKEVDINNDDQLSWSELSNVLDAPPGKG